MIRLNKILVATDFGDASDVALHYGRALAHTFGATLHLLHVAENTFLRAVPTDPHVLKAVAVTQLRDRLTDGDLTTLHAVASLETSDETAEAIVKYAARHAVGLIVMGTHGRAAIARLLVGSVAEKVVRTAPCPVLTVRQPERDFVVPDAALGSAQHEPGGVSMMTLKNILVATDFSEPSEAALTYGRALARTFKATLHVLHIVERVSDVVYGAEAYAVAIPELQQELEDSARKQLEDLLVDNDPHPLTTRQGLISSSAPAAAIVDYAGKEGIDLIVTGTHGRGGVAHLLMGSVAERVVRTAPCPVLTVRHPEHEFVVADTLAAAAKA
jgi:nucleotide-binding universal stress UspA family protein